MTVTELIARLEAVRAEHGGDLPVYFWCKDPAEVRELDARHLLVWRKGEGVGGLDLPKRVQIPS